MRTILFSSQTYDQDSFTAATQPGDLELHFQPARLSFDTAALAHGYEVAGWVRNLADGRVELQVAGEADEVSAFLGAIRESSLGGHISAEHVAEIEITNPFRGFRII